MLSNGEMLLYRQLATNLLCWSKCDLGTRVTVSSQHALHVVENIVNLRAICVAASPPLLITAPRGHVQTVRLVRLVLSRDMQGGLSEYQSLPISAFASFDLPTQPFHLLLTTVADDSEKLALMEMPPLVASTDPLSHLALVESEGYRFNILQMAYIQADNDGENELTAVAFAHAGSVLADTSPLYDANYYAHERSRRRGGLLSGSAESSGRGAQRVDSDEWAAVALAVGIALRCERSFDFPVNERVTCMRYTDCFALEPDGPRLPLLLVGVCVLTGRIDSDMVGGKLYAFRVDLSPHEEHTTLEKVWEMNFGHCVMKFDVIRVDQVDYLVLAKSASANSVSGWSKISLLNMETKKEEVNQFDIPNYVTSLVVIKNTVLIGDIKNGITFLIWKVRRVGSF